MMYNREGGYREKVRSYYLPGNTPAPPPAHRAHGSTSNAAEELINLTHLLFSARGGGAPPVEEGGYLLRLHAPCAEIDKKKCAGHRSTPIYEQSSAPPLKAPRGLQGGPLQSESIHSSLDIFKGSGHQKSESVFREFILRLELLSANYITTHLKLLSYSFECL